MNKYYVLCSMLISSAYVCANRDMKDAWMDDAIYKSSPRDKNIGYSSSPIPLSDLCLDPQIILFPGVATLISSGAAVEPSIAVNPKNRKKMVAVWQQGRINNGGSLEVGLARSEDGGHHWQKETIPFQDCIGGFIQRVSDVWLSYSNDGEILYLTALPVNATEDINTQNQQGIVVLRSTNDGKTWSIPHWVASSYGYISEPTGALPLDDKNSITADAVEALNAYCVWDRFPEAVSFHSSTFMSRTTDGGLTWSPHYEIYNPFNDPGLMSNGIENDCQTIGNVVVSCPNSGPIANQLLNFMLRTYATPDATDEEFMLDAWPYQYTTFDIAFVRSQDKGITWNTEATVVASLGSDDPRVYTGGYTYSDGQVTGGVGTLLRTGDILPSFAVNPSNGNLYVVWQTGAFREDQLPQIALSMSRDGGYTWSEPMRVSQTPMDAPNPQAFTPFVAVDKHGYVGVLYTDFRKDEMTNPDETKTNTWLAIFKERECGLEFKGEHRLSKNSYIAQNGPVTTQGVMTNGDYSFLVAADKRFYAIYTQSFNGPFEDPMLLLSLEDDITLSLDDNLRSAPFFSRVKAS